MKNVLKKEESERLFCLFFVIGGSSMYIHYMGKMTDMSPMDRPSTVLVEKLDVHDYYSDHEGVWCARSVLLNECSAYCAFVD